MPVPASPVKVTCRACGWHHVYRPRSDVLIVPLECPACAGTDLERRVAGPLDVPLSLLDGVLRALKGRRRTKS